MNEDIKVKEEKQTVLVAFYSKTMRDMISLSLKDQGYKVIEAVDGADALRYVFTDRPDCIITFVDLPIINGYNLSRILKNTGAFRNIGIIICSTEENSVFNFWAKNILCDGFFIPSENNMNLLGDYVAKIIAKQKKTEKKRYPAPTAKQIINLLQAAYDTEQFNLYILKGCYQALIDSFNIEELIKETVLAVSGVVSCDAIAVIVRGPTITEYYKKINELSANDFSEFMTVCRSDFCSKVKSKKVINWDLVKHIEENEISSLKIQKLKSYEFFEPSAEDAFFTIHIASSKTEIFNNRAKERLLYIINIYEKLLRHSIEYGKALYSEQKMKQSFSHFLPPKIIEGIISGASSITASVGEKRKVAILICDIRSFTTISEINEPEKVVEFLNQYFSIMGKIIRDNGGTIDKFMGDAIMALFGAPESYEDNGNRAANAALGMRQALKDLKIDLKMPEGYSFEIGTGIHYGNTIVGSIGSEEKKEYTVIGDNVNIASRIEGLTKIYGTPIIITDSVKEDLTDGQYTRHLDTVKVKGKSVPVAIYELAERDKKEDEEFLDNYQKAMNQYLIGNFSRAIDYFEKALARKIEDKASKVLLERCKNFLVNKPDNWDGAVALTTK